MKNIKQQIGFIALAAIIVLALAFTGCPDGNDKGGTVAVTGVTLDQTTLSLDVDGTGTLTATVAPANATNKAVTWSSSAAGVATVANGLVTAVSAGSATITVTTQDGNKTATCAVTVIDPNLPSLIYTASTLPDATVGTAYSQDIATATGAASGITYALTSGTLPAGLSLTTAGVIEGTPEAAVTDAAFFVTASADGYNSATAQFTITVNPATPYVITATATGFNATKDGADVSGAEDGTIADILTAIRTDADEAAVVIQFGADGAATPLDIGTGYAEFTTATPAWGEITLTGKITSQNTTTAQGTVMIGGAVSITSTADIANTVNSYIAVYHNSTGGLTVSGGTVSATTGRAIHNQSTGAVSISGGEVSATGNWGIAVYNASSGAVSISGGEVSATGADGDAVYNYSTGAVSISGGMVKAGTRGIAVRNASTGTVTISGGEVSATTSFAVQNERAGAVNISGGNISATSSYAVYNSSTGAVNISGGNISATTGSAVHSDREGVITVSGTATITSANTTATRGTIYLRGDISTATAERLVITGGTVTNTADSADARAVHNASTGAISISGGTVSANSGVAVHNNSTGVITVSGTPAITSANTSATSGTVHLNNVSGSTPVLILPANWADLIKNTASPTPGNVIYPTTAVSNPAIVTVGP